MRGLIICLSFLVGSGFASASEGLLCGNEAEFLALDRQRAGLPPLERNTVLKAQRQVIEEESSAVKAATPYTGSNALDDLLMKSLTFSFINEAEVIDEGRSVTEEQYINKGEVDPDNPEADQDGWVVEQRGFFDFEFHVFTVKLYGRDDDIDEIRFLVNTELSKDEALPLLERVAYFLVRMPSHPLLGIETVVIHKATNGRATGSPFGNTMTIYTNTIASSDSSFRNTLYHEMAHISVEENFYSGSLAEGWAAAQEADGKFLTNYGETNPDTEDFAETWVPWVRLKYFSDHATSAAAATMNKQVPNRFAFFEGIEWFAEAYFWPISQRYFWLGDQESVASLEEPVEGGVHSGISNIRGWAVSTRGVGRVAVYVDGVYAFEAPLGGARGDVGREFPDAKDSRYSGFGLTYNYGALSPGSHTMTIKAYGLDGSVTESSSTFTVASFHSEFFPADKPVELGSALLNASGDELTIQGAKIDNQNYDLVLKWQVPSQGFQVIAAD